MTLTAWWRCWAAKSPHIQNLAVGGVANPINLDSIGTLNLERLMYIKSFIDKLSDFVEQVYKVDTAVIAAYYPEWLERGKGAVNYLSAPEFPTDGKNRQFLVPGRLHYQCRSVDIPSDHLSLRRIPDLKRYSGEREARLV